MRINAFFTFQETHFPLFSLVKTFVRMCLWEMQVLSRLTNSWFLCCWIFCPFSCKVLIKHSLMHKMEKENTNVYIALKKKKKILLISFCWLNIMVNIEDANLWNYPNSWKITILWKGAPESQQGKWIHFAFFPRLFNTQYFWRKTLRQRID